MARRPVSVLSYGATLVLVVHCLSGSELAAVRLRLNMRYNHELESRVLRRHVRDEICGVDEYYDDVIHDCALCSDACRSCLAQASACSLCFRKCPGYYKEHNSMESETSLASSTSTTLNSETLSVASHTDLSTHLLGIVIAIAVGITLIVAIIVVVIVAKRKERCVEKQTQSPSGSQSIKESLPLNSTLGLNLNTPSTMASNYEPQRPAITPSTRSLSHEDAALSSLCQETEMIESRRSLTNSGAVV